ncbi:MAG TPA: hypothetical protein DEQ02_09590 [Ruminococcaceae bacterium]|nr:hypothetical protein [Oscillospiraceae bacterium]
MGEKNTRYFVCSSLSIWHDCICVRGRSSHCKAGQWVDEELDISLNNLDKEKEYVIRLTCSKVEHAEAVIAFDSSLVEDVVMPRKLT